MTETEKHIEEKNITLKGLEKTYEKFLEFKKSKNNELVVVGNPPYTPELTSQANVWCV